MAETETTAFDRDPLFHRPPCLRRSGEECLPSCEFGVVGPCARDAAEAEAARKIARRMEDRAHGR